jgi:histidine kinase
VTTQPERERLRLLYELGCAFAARIELADLLAFVLAKCREVLDAEGASVLLLDPASGELYFPYVAEADPAIAARLRTLRFPADQGIAGAVLRSGRSQCIDNAAADTRFYGGVDRDTGMTTRSLLAAPLTSRQGTIGVVEVLNCHHGAFTADDLGLLEALAGSIAVAIENARLYAALKEFAAGLERQVSDRTRELRDKNVALEHTLGQLRQTQDQLVAQEKLASLGQLTAGIAHEIKNPLNFVTNFAQLARGTADELGSELAMLGDLLDPARRESVDELLADLQINVAKIEEHGRRADAIVRDMLQHSRSGPGEPQPTDLNALLAEYVALAYHGARARDATFNATLETHYDAAVGLVRVVPQAIGRVFLNLLDNACYAVAARHRAAGADFAPRITVTTTRTDAGIEVRVRDNGTGIPAAERDKVFEPFFTTKPPGQGTGLGLSISHDIVRQHSGDLRVDSEEGAYAEFVVTLPQ